VVQAQPYLNPLVERAQTVKHALEEHKLVGPYVVRACATAEKTLAEVKVYCLSETDELGEVTDITEAVAAHPAAATTSVNTTSSGAAAGNVEATKAVPVEESEEEKSDTSHKPTAAAAY
jgi:hypothetical protein